MCLYKAQEGSANVEVTSVAERAALTPVGVVFHHHQGWLMKQYLLVASERTLSSHMTDEICHGEYLIRRNQEQCTAHLNG